MLSFFLVLKSLCGMAGEGYDTIGHESEYTERHSVSKLIGSPPGYVGYGDGRALIEAIHKKPITLIKRLRKLTLMPSISSKFLKMVV